MLKSFLTSIVSKHMSKKLINKTISEEDVAPILKQIRITLLDADVNLMVVKELIKNIRNKTVGQTILDLDPQKFIINIIKEELIEILGKKQAPINYDLSPCKIMLVGLQGSGKTTTAGKLAHYTKNKLSKRPLLVALDIYRPAAIEQLKTLSIQNNVDFFEKGTKKPSLIAEEALQFAKNNQNNTIIFDTAGRLQTNSELMDELVQIKNTINPHEILMVVDSMAGQDMVNVAKEFHDKLKLTGFIITKMDSDAQAGVALSLIHLLDVQVKLIGSGEKMNTLDIFYPERIADRILGLGDIASLMEKGKDLIDETSTKKSFSRMLAGKMTLDDLLTQTKQMQNLGSLGSIVKMLPNADKIMDTTIESAEEKMRVWTILMNSMTLQERKNPNLIKRFPSRRDRIIKGSGRKPDELNKLMNNWEKFRIQMDKMGQELRKGKNPFGNFFK